jgi:hypothetical protein
MWISSICYFGSLAELQFLTELIYLACMIHSIHCFLLVYFFLLWFVWCSKCHMTGTTILYHQFITDIISCRTKIAGLSNIWWRYVATMYWVILDYDSESFARCIIAIHLRTNLFINCYLWSWYAMLVCETFALICDCHVLHTCEPL